MGPHRVGGADGKNRVWRSSVIPDENAQDRLERLWNTRNRLAHGKACPIKEVEQLLTARKPLE